jgi:putative membrane protein
MPSRLLPFLKRWIITTFAVVVVAWIMPGVNYDSPVDLLVASLLLGILNAFLKPILTLIALPLVVVLMGIPILFINALVFSVVGWVIPGFHVESFWAAFWAGVMVSIISILVNLFLGGGKSRLEVRWQGRRRQGGRGPGGGPGSGPVIDV